MFKCKMTIGLFFVGLLCAGGLVHARAPQPATQDKTEHGMSGPMRELINYLESQHTTGFLLIQDGHVLVEQNWPAPERDKVFASFVYERTKEGSLLEDVASAQKSFVSVLVAIAVDKGLIDVEKPVSAYLGTGWSRAAADQEARIRVLDVLTMSSGLDEGFAYVAPAGRQFFYNTPVYAVTKRILTSASGQPLDAITKDWLTVPTGMEDTEWRQRPGALAGVGNATGLVTSPRDLAALGTMILKGGIGADGRRVVSQAGLNAMFMPSGANPAYGRLWWLNGSAFTVRASGRKDGPLIGAAPADMVAAFGALDRRLYIIPSKKLIVVRTGAAASDTNFDDEVWRRVAALLGS
jgi:CubicO group peptidase (beta-lactamase class C family)